MSISIIDFNQTADAIKSKGNSLPETGSNKVCGDKLCSEIKSKEYVKDYDKTTHKDSDKKHTSQELETYHLKTFDELDFDVFTNQKWDRLNESHSKDIIVHWPDGRQTEGIEPHIEDLKAMFVWAPDTRIYEHPVRIASGEWTSVIGIIEGTFTEPMPLPDGTVIEPTGKSFKLRMVTVGHWENGVMDEEYLFWDNLEFMKQIGLS
ncbi:MAG: ester cyclase [Nitrosopumilus sp.]|nr:ester cyclase [Nitrosopumilus sp.]